MSTRSLPSLLLWLLAACSSSPPAAPAEPPASAAPASAQAQQHAGEVPETQPTEAPAPRQTADGRLFGAEPTAGLPETPLSQLLTSPAPHVGKTVKTRGEVARVCERMGCWMELRAEAQQLRVPMAGHAFFIPKDAVGRTAVVEGELRQRPLSEAERAHLEGEGAEAVGALALHAKSVLVR